MKRPKGYQGNKAFLAWLKRQGIKESTARLYAAKSPPPAAEKWIKKYNEAFSSAVTTWPITPAPEPVSI